MPFNTVTVSAAVTPTVIETYITHYLTRKSLHQKPYVHISYHEGLKLIKQFLVYASHHTVEEVQKFTSQWVPCPTWVKIERVTIAQDYINSAAKAIQDQLGHRGVEKVGGPTWWQWRQDDRPLRAEWIEMRADHQERKKSQEKCRRVMLYVHGGAYFFGSVDEHRYQMQRHARKLKARVLAPRYRLAPQYPFPCGLLDCLGAYLYLISIQDPTEIILAGDSAGGGMIVSMLVVMRDQGIPLPAGAILISPWVDLTHSFPSVAAENDYDYIPSCGFMQRPSDSWPPPNADDMLEVAKDAIGKISKSMDLSRADEKEAIQGFSVTSNPKSTDSEQQGGANAAAQSSPTGVHGNTVPGPGHDISIMIDGKLVTIKDQIHMYATNQLLSHPLVSPILQPSLGGLPPLLILTGGGEVLRDEQIYLAHKAANPAKYPPGNAYLDEYPGAREILKKYKGTDVQLQLWDDCCHVTPTLSFTRPAKYMYRSIAQFGAWALARAQKTDIDIQDDDAISIISTDSFDQSDKDPLAKDSPQKDGSINASVGKAGDELPPFKNHMIRQRVDRNGKIFALDAPSDIPALQLDPGEIGVDKETPDRRWMEAKLKWDTKYAKEKRRVQKHRVRQMADGFQAFPNDEAPPPSALAARRGADMPKINEPGRSWGMSLWSIWGSKHDEKTIQREEEVDKAPEVKVEESEPSRNNGALDVTSRSRSRRRTVTDAGQTRGDASKGNEVNENTPAAVILARRNEDQNLLGPTYASRSGGGSNDVAKSSSTRPSEGPVAYPFKLAVPGHQEVNASTMTLQSAAGVVTPDAASQDAKVVQQGEVVEATRPEPQTFVTASEGVIPKPDDQVKKQTL